MARMVKNGKTVFLSTLREGQSAQQIAIKTYTRQGQQRKDMSEIQQNKDQFIIGETRDGSGKVKHLPGVPVKSPAGGAATATTGEQAYPEGKVEEYSTTVGQ